MVSTHTLSQNHSTRRIEARTGLSRLCRLGTWRSTGLGSLEMDGHSCFHFLQKGATVLRLFFWVGFLSFCLNKYKLLKCGEEGSERSVLFPADCAELVMAAWQSPRINPNGKETQNVYHEHSMRSFPTTRKPAPPAFPVS